MEKVLELPLFGPIVALLKSRKFLIAVLTVGVDALVAQVPQLAAVKDQLLAVSVVLASVLIGAIAHEDGKEKGAPVTVLPPEVDAG